MITYTVSQAAERLNITRDRIHYLIRQEVISPRKIRNRYILTPAELDLLREHESESGSFVRGLMLLEVEAPYSDDTMKELATHHQMIWCASVFGEPSIIALLESPSLEELSNSVFKIQGLPYSIHSTTYVVHANQWYESGNKPSSSNLACTLLRVNRDSVSRNFQRLRDIDAVIRCGTLFGNWDLFAEIWYEDKDHLRDIIMNQIQKIGDVSKTNTLIAMSSPQEN